MISACELCAKITLENALRDEATRVAKMKAAKSFAEEIIAPIVTTLTEVPDHLEIGFRSNKPNSHGLFRGIGEWKKDVTVRGNPMEYRDYTKELKGEGDYEKLDYEVLNQYLAEFGFQISTETKWVKIVKYSTSTRDREDVVDVLYLSMTCPLEDC